MPESANNGGDATSEITPEAFTKLQEQVENLNKGIASYRDEAKSWRSKHDELQTSLEDFKSKVDFTAEEDPEVELDPKDAEKLKKWAEKQGFVTSDELESEKMKIRQESIKSIESQAVSEFIEKYPDYDKDEEWAKVKSEFELYKTPASLDGYRKLLKKIHSDISGGSDKTKEDAKAQARAELVNKGRLSLGGGSQGGSEGKNQDVESLQKRYPNLSRDQILERVSEIKSLYPKK